MRTTRPTESTQWWRLSISDVGFLFVIAGGIFYLALPAPREPARSASPPAPPPIAVMTSAPLPVAAQTAPPLTPPLVVIPAVGLPSPSPEPVASIQIATPEPPAPVTTTPPATAASEVDRQRADGEQRLEQSMAQLENEARTLLDGARRYRYSGCSEAGAYGVGAAIVCTRSRQQLGELFVAIGRGLEAAEEDARRSWVDPGTVRDVRSKHGLDAPAWDKLADLVARLDERAQTRH